MKAAVELVVSAVSFLSGVLGSSDPSTADSCRVDRVGVP
jgi:hypothetical protein